MTPEIVLTAQQQEALDKIKQWLEAPSNNQEFKLGGFAGTGKTTIIKTILNELKQYHFSVCAFTGKAVDVLNKKGIYNASTIHSLIYNTQILSDGAFNFTLKLELENHIDVIIVDESSMISTQLYNDLKSFQKKLLFIGDPGQLEPIGENPNLMKSPDYTLTEIHRQASESSIILLATEVRTTGKLNSKLCDVNLSFQNKPSLNSVELMQYNQVICAKNNTRIFWNNRIRSKKNFPNKTIVIGDKLIVLRNNLQFNVFNGMILTVIDIKSELTNCWTCNLKDELGKILYNIPIWKFPFEKTVTTETKIPSHYVYADFGYVITCHKAQGSEWEKVCVIDEINPYWNMQRWRYTSITRASKQLNYVI